MSCINSAHRFVRNAAGIAALKAYHPLSIVADAEVNTLLFFWEKIEMSAVGVTIRTVENVRQRLVEQGLEAALERKKRETPPVEPKLTGDKEARIIALSPSGLSRKGIFYAS